MNGKKLLYGAPFHLIPPSIKNSLRNTFIKSDDPYYRFKPKRPSVLATTLVKSYFEQGMIREARILFDEMPFRDVVAWTAMIAGYASCNYDSYAWECFVEMLRNGTNPNEFTFSSVLKVCRGMKVLEYGASVHSLLVKSGIEGSLYVDNGLMDMYATCSASMDSAWTVFRDIKQKSVVTWTTLITGFTHRGDGYGGLKMFKRMLLEGTEMTPYCLTIAVKACTSIGSLTIGKQLHASVIKQGFQTNLPVMNSILDLYCRCGCIHQVNQYFHDMEEKNLISWNTLIAYYERSDSSESLILFSRMESEGFTPNCYTFTSVIAACASLTALNCGQQVHGGILRKGFQDYLALANALIDMYAKCGNISDSHKIFSQMTERSLVSWTCMMIGCGAHGYGRETVHLFEQMIKSGIRPDRIVFMAVVSACSHAGLVDEGLKYFQSMTSDYGIRPGKEIYGCVVDLLARSGRVEEAYQLIESIPFKADETIWGALLGACKAHRFTKLGRLVAHRILESIPRKVGTYVMLSYVYAAEGKWGMYAKVRKLMRGIGNRKEAGTSWIEVRNEVF